MLDILNNRKSIRVYEEREIPKEDINEILKATMRAPTAGNMMLYSVINVTDASIKEKLSITCDNQDFIAKAPLVLLFIADYQRWYDYFLYTNKDKLKSEEEDIRTPQEGDLMIAISDALIGAQNSVIAAEILGIGSCYIGDIIENYEEHKIIFDLPQYTFPIAMVCFGYPTKQQEERPKTDRFKKEYIVFENKYKRLNEEEFVDMFKDKKFPKEYESFGEFMYNKKFTASFTEEMTRSVREILKNWR